MSAVYTQALFEMWPFFVGMTFSVIGGNAVPLVTGAG